MILLFKKQMLILNMPTALEPPTTIPLTRPIPPKAIRSVFKIMPAGKHFGLHALAATATARRLILPQEQNLFIAISLACQTLPRLSLPTGLMLGRQALLEIPTARLTVFILTLTMLNGTPFMYAHLLQVYGGQQMHRMPTR